MGEPDSNGFPFLNAIGQELEKIDQQFKENANDLFIKTANENQLNRIYYIDKINFTNKNTITASSIYGDISVNVVNSIYDLFNNKPSRIEEIDTKIFSGINLTGLSSGIYNINYFFDKISGYYYLINDVNAANPSSIIIYNDNFTPIDNMTYASGRVDYDSAGFYEIITPESSGDLMEKYPLLRYVSSGDPYGTTISYKFEDHYEPQPSSGWANKWYYDEDGTLKYHFTRLNNPFGSGAYNISSGILTYTPIENTIKVYDILNLNISGEATEIPSTGLNLYKYTSPGNDFEYIGYESVVPRSYDLYGGQSATLFKTTSWFQGRTSGFLDNDVPPNSGTFRYIQGSGELTNHIWFYNPISKYMIKYDYSKFKYLNDITTNNRYLSNIDLLPTNAFLASEKTNYEGHDINWEFSKTGISGIRIDPDILRPGSKATITLTINDTHSNTWINPSGSAFSLNLYKKNLGYTQEIIDKNFITAGVLV